MEYIYFNCMMEKETIEFHCIKEKFIFMKSKLTLKVLSKLTA